MQTLENVSMKLRLRTLLEKNPMSVKEVEIILQHTIKDHVILIDDSRCFDGVNGYPKLEELRNLIERSRPGYEFSAWNDVIRIHPKKCVQSEF
jgi:hypothetical protein